MNVRQVLTVSGNYDTISIFTDDTYYYVYNERNDSVAEVYENYEDAKEAAMFLAGQKGNIYGNDRLRRDCVERWKTYLN